MKDLDYKILANGGTISDKESLELNESCYDGDYIETLSALDRIIKKGLKMKHNYDCVYCKDTKSIMYDEIHSTVCPHCCKHDKGFWLLKEHYGADNGKMCCLNGCGFVKDKEGQE